MLCCTYSSQNLTQCWYCFLLSNHHRIRWAGPMSLVHTVQTGEWDWIWGHVSPRNKSWGCVMLSRSCPFLLSPNWDGFRPTGHECRSWLPSQAKHEHHGPSAVQMWIPLPLRGPWSPSRGCLLPVCPCTGVPAHRKTVQRSHCSVIMKILVFLYFIS